MIPYHTMPSMHFNTANQVVNESLRKICHYQQNVPQQITIFLDTLRLVILDSDFTPELLTSF